MRFMDKLAEMRKQLDHRWKQIDKFESSVKTYAETKAGWRRKFSAKEGELDAIKVTFYSHPLSVRCSCSFVVGDQRGYGSPINKPEMTRCQMPVDKCTEPALLRRRWWLCVMDP